jgi:PAS domain S-box-containing protein
MLKDTTPNRVPSYRRLIESEAFSRKVLNASLNGIYIYDVKLGKHVYVNDQYRKLTGYALQDLEKMGRRDFFERFHPDHRQRIVAHTKALVRGRADVLEIEYRFQTKEGRWIWCFSRDGVFARGRDGLVSQFVGTFLDITERKLFEERLLQDIEMSAAVNRLLDQRVRNRTAEIEAQCRELERLNRLNEKLSRKTLEAMENERKALSKEIHDSIAGTLAAIKMQLEAQSLQASECLSPDSMPLDKIVGHLTEVIQETKKISNQLRSPTLDHAGLQAAIDEHIANFKEFYPEIEVVAHTDIGAQDLHADLQTVIYRVAQEALNNVGKHSAAKTVQIQLSRIPGQIRLKIADDGFGFDVRSVLSDAESLTGFGLHSMRQRVELCSGRFEIHSKPQKGTAIHISIPL